MPKYRFSYEGDTIEEKIETSFVREIENAVNDAHAFAQRTAYLKAINGTYVVGSMQMFKDGVWQPVLVSWECFQEIESAAPLKEAV